MLFTGGSAYGLSAADGVMRWCEERGRGYATPAGLVPLVPAAVIYDLTVGDEARRPGAEEGYAACEAAAGGVPRAGEGRSRREAPPIGKVRGREHASPGGVGYAAEVLATGETVAALAVVNATGDVIAADGERHRRPAWGRRRAAPQRRTCWPRPRARRRSRSAEREGTTLVCVITDAGLDKPSTAKVARMASAGVARAVDPVFTPFDGDVVFCLACGEPTRARG